MNLILLGLPAAGKGTQAKKISQEYGLTHISTGDILRDIAREDNRRGRNVKEYLDAGELVPDEIVVNIIKEKMQQEDLENGFVFDGFPRTLGQAEALTEILHNKDMELDLAIHLEIEKDEVIKRISGRRVCEDCGATYHIEYNPPEKEGICDKCGGKLIQRSDDEEETVRKRVELHSELIDQLTTYYQERGVLATVISEGGIDEVFRKIKEAIEVNL